MRGDVCMKKGSEGCQDDLYLGQVLPDIKSSPKCPECNSDRVAGIFHGNMPSSGSGSKNHGPQPSGRLAKLLESQDVVLGFRVNIQRNKPRPMWHCHDCSNNFG